MCHCFLLGMGRQRGSPESAISPACIFFRRAFRGTCLHPSPKNSDLFLSKKINTIPWVWGSHVCKYVIKICLRKTLPHKWEYQKKLQVVAENT